MSDLDRLLEEARLFQMEQDLAPPVSRPPSIVPWVCLAVVLMLVSLGIELFWPLPVRDPVPLCQEHETHMTSCQKPTLPP